MTETSSYNRREGSNQLAHLQHAIVFQELSTKLEADAKHLLLSETTRNPEADVQYERTGPGYHKLQVHLLQVPMPQVGCWLPKA